MNNNLFLAIKTESLKIVAHIQKNIFEKIIFQMHIYIYINNNLFLAIKTESLKIVAQIKKKIYLKK